MPYAAKPPPKPLERSCIKAMDLIMSLPENRYPFLFMIPEMAHPDGILILPSFRNMFATLLSVGVSNYCLVKCQNVRQIFLCKCFNVNRQLQAVCVPTYSFFVYVYSIICGFLIEVKFIMLMTNIKYYYAIAACNLSKGILHCPVE